MEHSLTVQACSNHICCARFAAMASPCEILIDTDDVSLTKQIGRIAMEEALRIEAKFSRYRSDSIVSSINNSNGRPITVDAETALLLDFSRQCHMLSEGLFDITSGVLRKAWKFDGSDRVPEEAAVDALLPLVGFQRLDWRPPVLAMPPGMELDFGGIGKEYAVDRVLGMLANRFNVAILVNFGGDLCTNRAPRAGTWQVGIERPDTIERAALVLELSQGGLATSGDARRFLLRNGQRYSHILNPLTGWPVVQAPRSVTVAAATCMEAGMLATFSLLQGTRAREFLKEQGVQYWCLD